MTVKPPDLASLLAFAAIFTVVAGAMSLWRKRVAGLRGLEAVKAATDLARFGAGLEYYGLRAKEIETSTSLAPTSPPPPRATGRACWSASGRRERWRPG